MKNGKKHHKYTKILSEKVKTCYTQKNIKKGVIT